MTVDLRGVSKRYGAVPVLDDVGLSVRPGEFLALLGPSGSGKTTLLRIVAGLERDFVGSLSIGGRDMTRVPARERNIGMVFQSYALFPHMTVLENVTFGLRVRRRRDRLPARAIEARARSLLNLVQIPDLADRYPAQVSGGQRQRVALARALATEPGVLLLDEPFGALDPMVRKELRAWLRGLHDRLGLTTILVTHDQEEAAEMADRIAVMRGGRIEQVGSPTELEASPASPFVYAFLGDCIRFDGRVVDGMFLFADPGLAPIPTAILPGPAVAMIRPHDIRVLRDGGPAEVVSSRRKGVFVYYRLLLGERELDLVRSSAAPPMPVGSACGLDLRAARCFPRRVDGSAAADADIGGDLPPAAEADLGPAGRPALLREPLPVPQPEMIGAGRRAS